jgi:hypothetical protein
MKNTRFVPARKHWNLARDLAIMTLAFLTAVLSVIFTFESLRYFGYFKSGELLMHGAAPVKTISLAEIAGNGKEAPAKNTGPLNAAKIQVKAEKINGYAYVGQRDVLFLKFSLSSLVDAKLKSLDFDMGGYARPSDIKNLQIYLDKKLIGEAPFFEASGIFDKLNIDLPKNQELDFEIKGTVSDEAFSGDRVRIGFKDADSLNVVDQAMNKLSPGAGFSAWGGYVSIIGSKK